MCNNALFMSNGCSWGHSQTNIDSIQIKLVFQLVVRIILHIYIYYTYEKLNFHKINDRMIENCSNAIRAFLPLQK